MGIEPTRDLFKPHTGFEDQERHQAAGHLPPRVFLFIRAQPWKDLPVCIKRETNNSDGSDQSNKTNNSNNSNNSNESNRSDLSDKRPGDESLQRALFCRRAGQVVQDGCALL